MNPRVGSRRRAGGVAAAVLAAVAACAGSQHGVASAGADEQPDVDERAVAVPADFVELVDDTGVLTISVPAAWTDVDTAPGTNDDGTPMAWISASTDFATYRETFDAPGAVFIGVTYTTDLQSWIDRWGQSAACATESFEPYDDGAFQGIAALYEQCGASGAATFLVIAANVGEDTTRSYVLQLQAPTAAEVALFEPVLNSFNAVGLTSTDVPDAAVEDAAPAAGVADEGLPPLAAPPPVSMPDGSSLVPATAPGQQGPAPTVEAGPFTPAGVLAEGALQVTDDTRRITMAIPPDWVETATAPAGDGSALLVASPQLAAFAPADPSMQTFTVPGVRFVANPYTADTAAAVTAAAGGLACTPGVVQAYEDPVFTGHILQLSNCAGTASRVYLVAASPSDQSLTASLLIQVTDPDDSDLQTILSSFDVARDEMTGPTTVAPSPVPAPSSTAAPQPVATLAAPTVPASTTPVAGTVGSIGVFTAPTAVPAGTIRVVDDTGFLVIGVPPEWADRRTAPLTSASGTVPSIIASANVAAFLPDPAGAPDPGGGAGVVFTAVPFTADTMGLLAQLAATQGCTAGLVQTYEDVVFTGQIQELTACGGTATRRFVVVANPADARFTAVVLVQVTDDPVVLDTVLATFDYEPTAAAPGESATPSSTTTTTP